MGERKWHCGFCGCLQDEAAHMVRAQAVAICGMCIVDAAATLAGQGRTGEATRQLVESVSRATERLGAPQVIDELRALRSAVNDLQLSLLIVFGEQYINPNSLVGARARWQWLKTAEASPGSAAATGSSGVAPR